MTYSTNPIPAKTGLNVIFQFRRDVYAPEPGMPIRPVFSFPFLFVEVELDLRVWSDRLKRRLRPLVWRQFEAIGCVDDKVTVPLGLLRAHEIDSLEDHCRLCLAPPSEKLRQIHRDPTFDLQIERGVCLLLGRRLKFRSLCEEPLRVPPDLLSLASVEIHQLLDQLHLVGGGARGEIEEVGVVQSFLRKFLLMV
jgi:hypothetical protein